MQPIYSIDSADGTSLFVYKQKQMEVGYRDSVHCYDELKFVRIVKGHGLWRIGNRDYDVSSGDILIMSRADIRQLKSIVAAPFVIEQVDFVPAFLAPLQGVTDFFISRTSEFQNLLPRDAFLSQKLDELISEILCDRVYKEQAVKVKLADLVITTARLLDIKSEAVHISDKRMDTVEKAKAYIREHFSEPITLDDTARRFFLSPSYFSRLFKQYSGMTFQDYVAHVRVKEVITLIDSQPINILDAAMQCGFSCSSGFYKTFKHVTGSIPKMYKK